MVCARVHPREGQGKPSSRGLLPCYSPPYSLQTGSFPESITRLSSDPGIFVHRLDFYICVAVLIFAQQVLLLTEPSLSALCFAFVCLR